MIGIASTYLQQPSFQAGDVQTTLPIMTVLEPMIAAVVGSTLLHERLRTGDLRMTVTVAAAATMATVALAQVDAIACTRVA